MKNNWPEVLATITGPIGWAVYAVVKYWDQIKSATITAFNSVITFFKEWGPLLLAALGGPIGLAVYAVVKNWDAIKNATITAFNAVTKFLSDTWNGIKLITSIVVNAMVEDVRNQWNQFKSMTTTTFNAVKSFFSSVWDGIKSIFTTVTSAIFNSVKQSWENTKANTTTVFNAVKSFLSNVWDGIKSVVNNAASAVFNYVKDKWNSLKTSTTNIFNDIKSFLTTIWNSIKSFVQDTATTIYNKVKTAWNNTQSNTTSIFNAIKSFLISLWDNIKSRITTSVNNIKSGVVNAWNAVKSQTTNIFNNIKSKVTGIFDDIVSAAKKLPGRIGDGIKAMAGKVKSGVDAIGKKLAGGLETVVNTITQKGINVVLKKIGVDKDNLIPELNIPGYKKGTGGHPQDGPAFVGDGGEEELIRLPNGSTYLSPNKTTLIPNMPKGTEVLSGKQTKQFFSSVAAYKKGTNRLANGAKKAKEWVQTKAEDAAHKTKEVAGKAKDKVSDVIGDVWSYASDPGKLMKKVFDSLNLKLPDVGGMMGQLAKSGVSKIKDGAVGFIKSKMDEFMPSFGDDGDSSKVGPGSGYGGMRTYVETWYNRVKDMFGPTHFMGAYNNRNVRGGSSKSMHAYGRAFDIGGSGSTMSKIADYLRKTATNLQYVIYNRRIAGPGMGKAWRKYSGVNPHTDHVHADFFPPAGQGGGGYSGPISGKLSNWIDQAMKMRGVSGSEWKNGLAWIINKESTGNPRAVGAPTSDGTAKGLMQLKHFNYKGDPFNPVNNIYWGIKYIKDRYKSIGGALSWWRKHNWYAKGGVIDRDQIARVGEGGKKEVIIPLEQFKERAIQLLMYAAEKLGFDMTGMFSAQPQALGASSFSNVQSTMTTMSNKFSPEGLKLQGNSGQVIEVVVHNHTELDGKELAKGSYKYTTEYQERDKRSKSSFKKRGGKVWSQILHLEIRDEVI
ncbi:transglycosylase SLT domain-containing protein [Priestia sp. OVL9]|nr:transglycosylase SLT domain-containing protein [Priestia sp. OVL9]